MLITEKLADYLIKHGRQHNQGYEVSKLHFSYPGGTSFLLFCLIFLLTLSCKALITFNLNTSTSGEKFQSVQTHYLNLYKNYILTGRLLSSWAGRLITRLEHSAAHERTEVYMELGTSYFRTYTPVISLSFVLKTKLSLWTLSHPS